MDKCVNCGRRLKSEKSRGLGYGPVCYGKIFGGVSRVQGKKNNISIDNSIPGQISLDDYLSGQ